MIVVEGPDGAGKTTLIRQLTEAFNLTVAARVVDKLTRPMVDLRTWVEMDNARTSKGMIYDRHRLISETIYGPILRPDPAPGFNDLQWLIDQMSFFYGKKPIIIYCLPPIRTVLDNCLTGGENDHFDAETVRQIYRGYIARAAMDRANAGAMIYDYTAYGVNAILATIQQRILHA